MNRKLKNGLKITFVAGSIAVRVIIPPDVWDKIDDLHQAVYDQAAEKIAYVWETAKGTVQRLATPKPIYTEPIFARKPFGIETPDQVAVLPSTSFATSSTITFSNSSTWSTGDIVGSETVLYI